MDTKPQFDFKVCPNCIGYGVPDRGGKCRKCEGSGELIVERGTYRVISKSEFYKMMTRDSGE